MCVQTSPSGCQSGSCGHPTSAAHSGKSLSRTSERLGERQPERRAARLEQEFLHFAPHPFCGEVVEGDAAADRCGGRIDVELEAGNELQGAKHPEAVVGERVGIDDPEEALLEVAPAVEGIEVLVGQRIPGDGVDGEIAPAGGFDHAQVRIADDLEPPVAAARFRLPSREGDVEAGDLVDGEALADGVDGAEPGEQLAEAAGVDPVDLEIDVQGGAADEAVPNPAADDQGAAAGGAGGRGDGEGQRELAHERIPRGQVFTFSIWANPQMLKVKT